MEIEIEIRAISGELEMSFTMLDTEHFRDLQQRVIQQLTSERGLPRLLLEGQALEPPARSSLKSLGILPPKGVFQLIRVRPPAECVCSYHVAIGQEGYHVHDSFLRQVPSVDPKAFYICWRRSFSEKGGSFHGHINLIRNKVYPTGCSLREEVVLNTTRTAATAHRIKDQAMLFRMEADYLQRGPATLALLGGKALMNVVSSSGTSHLRASGPTVELVLVQPGQSERQVMWRHAEDEKLMAAFEGRLQLQKFYVTEDQRTYAVGSRTNHNGGPMAGRVILRCDLDLEWGRLSFPEWADVEKCGPLPESSSGGFAGSDKEGKRLYFFEEHSGYEQLTIYSISTETLGERVEVLLPKFDFEKENGDTKWVVLDPKTEDLYFLHDFALQYASLATDDDSDAPEVTEALGGPTCSVYRLRCNPDAELGRRYESSSYDLICHACLEIDGFSDSFSVALAAYDSDQDCLVIFDAGEQLWRLPLREARWQDPLEE